MQKLLGRARLGGYFKCFGVKTEKKLVKCLVVSKVFYNFALSNLKQTFINLLNFTTMKKEMTSEDIIPMEQITNLLERPLTSVDSVLEIKERDITARSEFNKVMYLVYEGKLRQFKIKKGIKFPFNWYRKFTNGEGVSRQITNILIIEVAGIGELAVDARMWGYTFNFYIYDSIEDFKADNYSVLSREHLCDRMQDIYDNVCTIGGVGDKYLHRYTWNGTTAVVYSLKENISLFFTYDANEFDNQMHGWYEGYATKEECENDNAIQVAVFASEDEEKKNEVQNVVVKCSIAINGIAYDVTDEETLEKIKKLLNY